MSIKFNAIIIYDLLRAGKVSQASYFKRQLGRLKIKTPDNENAIILIQTNLDYGSNFE